MYGRQRMGISLLASFIHNTKIYRHDHYSNLGLSHIQLIKMNASLFAKPNNDEYERKAGGRKGLIELAFFIINGRLIATVEDCLRILWDCDRTLSWGMHVCWAWSAFIVSFHIIDMLFPLVVRSSSSWLCSWQLETMTMRAGAMTTDYWRWLLDDNASRALTMAVGGFADQWNRQWIEVHDVTDIPNDGEARGCEL